MFPDSLIESEPFANFEAMVAEFGRLLLLREKVVRRIEEPSGEEHRVRMLERLGAFGLPEEPGRRAPRLRSNEDEELRNAGLEQWLADEEARYRLRVSLALGCGRLKNWEHFVRRHKLSEDESEIVLALLSLRDAHEHEEPWREVCLLGVEKLSAPPDVSTSTSPTATN